MSVLFYPFYVIFTLRFSNNPFLHTLLWTALVAPSGQLLQGLGKYFNLIQCISVSHLHSQQYFTLSQIVSIWNSACPAAAKTISLSRNDVSTQSDPTDKKLFLLYCSLTHFFTPPNSTGRWSIVSKSPKGLYLLGMSKYYNFVLFTDHFTDLSNTLPYKNRRRS